MKLILKTISPVHVGTGVSLEPFEYIIDGNMFYRLNQNKAFLYAIESHPEFPEIFGKWLENTQLKLDSETDNKRQSEIRKAFNFKSFCERELNDKALVRRILQSGYLYKCPVEYGTLNKKQILEMMKSPSGESYIPATSIKGAIRTSLLYNAFANTGIDEKKRLMDEIIVSKEFAKTNGKYLGKSLEEKYFNCGENKNSTVIYSNIQLDLMKFIHVSDAVARKADFSILPANLYQTDKEYQEQTPALETINDGAEFEFSISVNKNELLRIADESRLPNSRSWKNFDEKFMQLFGFSIVQENSVDLEEKIVNSIKKSLNSFGKAIMENEQRWISDYRSKVSSRRKTIENANIENLKNFYNSLPQSGATLRIGWASGFISTTIFSALLLEPSLKVFAKQIMKQFKLGIPPTKKRDLDINPASPDKFPKSKRLTAENNASDVHSPLGWCVVLTELEAEDYEKNRINVQLSDNQPLNVQNSFSEEECMRNNALRHYKNSDIIEAKFLGCEGKMIQVMILDERFADKIFSFSYGDSKAIEERKYFKIRICDIRKDEIKAVKFAGYL